MSGWASVGEAEGIAVRADRLDRSSVLNYLEQRGNPDFVLVARRFTMAFISYIDRDPRCRGIIAGGGGVNTNPVINAREAGIPVYIAGALERTVGQGEVIRFRPPHVEVSGRRI